MAITPLDIANMALAVLDEAPIDSLDQREICRQAGEGGASISELHCPHPNVGALSRNSDVEKR
ncbi:hypothetical protein NKJ46_26190 [Mesorhizobium sp. M0166]|uniref:hypothetical protein n=1 Tax=Mesorhizobium sp. M0166 TaxID=2956902 RepID=UPI00333C212A